MPKIAPVFNGAHSNFCSQSFLGQLVPLWGGVSYKTESAPITPVKQSWFSCMGCLKPCANFVGITVISAPVSSKKINLFLFHATFHKILWSLCWITGER